MVEGAAWRGGGTGASPACRRGLCSPLSRVVKGGWPISVSIRSSEYRYPVGFFFRICPSPLVACSLLSHASSKTEDEKKEIAVLLHARHTMVKKAAILVATDAAHSYDFPVRSMSNPPRACGTARTLLLLSDHPRPTSVYVSAD